MIRPLIATLCLVLIFESCKSKKEDTSKTYVSVVSIIRKQVEKIDTSLYSILKIDYIDSTHADTTYVARENFAALAKDFLETPDLSDKKVAKQYREDQAVVDQMLNRVILTYVPIDPKKQEFKKQELVVTPVPGEDAKINNIIIIREVYSRDSFLQKKLLWQIDKSFQIVTTSQKPGQIEKTITTRVVWNEDNNQ